MIFVNIFLSLNAFVINALHFNCNNWCEIECNIKVGQENTQERGQTTVRGSYRVVSLHYFLGRFFHINVKMCVSKILKINYG